MAFMARQTDIATDISQRLANLEHQAELIKTVLMVKDPQAVDSGLLYEGLRKQVIASASERRSHLVQLATMAVAVGRARSVDDLRPQVQEWLDQADVAEVHELPDGHAAKDYFESLDGTVLDWPFEVVEPAYVDRRTNALIRLGRARSRRAPSLANQSAAEQEEVS